MILQSLYDYYQRRMQDSDPTCRLPIYGFEEKPIPYLIEIDRQGALVNLHCTLSADKKPVAKTYLVPQTVKRASNVAANLLWDTLEYVLGVDTRGKPERVKEQHAAFLQRLRDLPASAQQDPGLQAIHAFYAGPGLAQLQALPEWPKLLEDNPNLSFILQGDTKLICERAAISSACLPSEEVEADSRQVQCLVSGNIAPLENLHTAIKGVWGAQSVGANIVSFNAPAYCSFGREQGANAPVGKPAVFAYTTALNALLARESGQRVQVGDASTVFWAERRHDLESLIPDCFGEMPKDEPQRGAQAVQRVYEWVASGRAASLEGEGKFFVLGLAPNAARIAVRFWHSMSLAQAAQRTVQHFNDLAICHASFEPDYPSLFRLLSACAAQGKADNIPPKLGGDVIRAVLDGSPYPYSLLQAAVLRNRAEQNVNYLRAALLKACLNRQIRRALSENKPAPNNGKEFTPMLDPDNQDPGYCLGRLFAALEKLQEAAADRQLNSTIRDRYFAAAASSPTMVFNTLMRLHHHHLAKLRKSSPGYYVRLDKLIGEIMGKFGNQFPHQLGLREQACFALGYYHQRQDFFQPQNTDSAEKDAA